jgi:hypothetical protein
VSWCAYVDESLRLRLGEPGLYILAAALVSSEEEDLARAAVARLGHGKRRFHWRVEEPRDQKRAVRLLGGFAMMHLVVVAVHLDGRRQERGRRQCLERLLWELDQLGVERVLLDERTESLNARDRQMISRMSVKGMLRPEMRVEFGRYFNGVDGEVLLWVPDIVAGAVGAARGDGDFQFVEPIRDLLVEIDIEFH